MMNKILHPTTLDDLEKRLGRLVETFAANWRKAGGGTGEALQELKIQLEILEGKLDIVMATQAEDAAALKELKQGLTDVATQLSKATDEILAKIKALTDAAANADVNPELQAAIDDVKAAGDALKPVAQALDDVVPDTTP